MGDFTALSKYNVYDDYYTPAWVWEKIVPLIPKDKVIWEACMLNATTSKSMNIWRDFGYEVVGNTEWDILTCDIPKCDMIITNIPFETEIKKKILRRLMAIDKPFIIIMNSMNTFANYFHEIMDLENTQIITPKQKLHFCKDGEAEKRNTSFYSVFVAYKMNLSNKQLWV
jgi:hypothetical protein